MLHLRRKVVAIVSSLVAIGAFVGIADAHDFWLVPNAFHVVPGAQPGAGKAKAEPETPFSASRVPVSQNQS